MKFPNPITFVKAILASVRELYNTGSVIVPSHVVQKRLETCYRCNDYNPTARQCRVCSCYLDLKTQLRAEECPKKKWGRWPKKPFDKVLKN